MKLIWKLLALLAGLGLFGWYLTGADWKSIAVSLASLGWLAPVALVPYFCVYIVDCFAWRITFQARLPVSFVTLFRIRWAGEAVNNVVPSAYVGGEAVKIYLLKRHGVCASTATSSAVVSKTAQTVAQCLFVLLASIVFLYIGADRPGLRLGIVAMLGASATAVFCLFWVQRRGIFSSVCQLADALRLKITALNNRREQLQALDQTITTFYQRHRPRFLASTGAYLGGFLLDTMEIYLVAHLMGMGIAWQHALVVEAFTSVAKMLGMWIPGSLGVQESGIVMVGRLTGLPDTLTVAYAILRRARELIFAAAGWALLSSEAVKWSMLKSVASH